jgi:hypothetical protein
MSPSVKGNFMKTKLFGTTLIPVFVILAAATCLARQPRPKLELAPTLARAGSEYASHMGHAGFTSQIELANTRGINGAIYGSRFDAVFLSVDASSGVKSADTAQIRSESQPTEFQTVPWVHSTNPIDIGPVVQNYFKTLSASLNKLEAFAPGSDTPNQVLILSVQAALGPHMMSAGVYPLNSGDVDKLLGTLPADTVIAIAGLAPTQVCNQALSPFWIFNVKTGELLIDGRIESCPIHPGGISSGG